MDPVVLCATGQIYDYETLRQWFVHGNRLCPKTNIEVLDVQVTRLPWLKCQIREWLEAHNMPMQDQDPVDSIREMHPMLGQLVHDIKRASSGGGSALISKRAEAVAELVRVFQDWDEKTGLADGAREMQRTVRSAVMDDLIWMVRYGDAYLQGVAASALACSDTPEENRWLAAAAVFPVVALLQSSVPYTQEAAMQVLYNVVLESDVAHKAVWTSGGVQGLLSIISKGRDEVRFHRDRVAVTLATMVELGEVKAFLRKFGVEPLKRMLLTSEDRWEKRDAAFALLTLELTEPELGDEVSMRKLEDYRWCSRAWLNGEVANPADGLTSNELLVRAQYESAMAEYLRAQQQHDVEGGAADVDADMAELEGEVDQAAVADGDGAGEGGLLALLAPLVEAGEEGEALEGEDDVHMWGVPRRNYRAEGEGGGATG